MNKKQLIVALVTGILFVFGILSSVCYVECESGICKRVQKRSEKSKIALVGGEIMPLGILIIGGISIYILRNKKK